MLLKYKLKGLTSTHGFTFDNLCEQEVPDKIGAELLEMHPAWFENITPKAVKVEPKKEVEKDSPKVLVEDIEEGKKPTKKSSK